LRKLTLAVGILAVIAAVIVLIYATGPRRIYSSLLFILIAVIQFVRYFKARQIK